MLFKQQWEQNLVGQSPMPLRPAEPAWNCSCAPRRARPSAPTLTLNVGQLSEHGTEKRERERERE
eukprot:COSAG03_NODE_15216_length_437_cov_2.434911_1_plen_64_part_10